MDYSIIARSNEPIYRQISRQVEEAVFEGRLKAGEQLPSINELAAILGISRETAKKAYKVLSDKGIILPHHGKGFFAADVNSDIRPQVLVIFDKFSVLKQIIFNAFAETLGESAEITILNHNQSVDLLEYYLDNNLDHFNYYVVSPHFPLDPETQRRALKQLSRIPNRKLIMLDRIHPDYPGNFGAVYQDFRNDIYTGLSEALSRRGDMGFLRVITLPASLYGPEIRKGIERFASEHGIRAEFLTEAPDDIHPNDTFLVLNSQLDAGLVGLVRKIQESSLEIGRDVRIISYNEMEMNELVLGGLTTVSTDFREMGRLAAEMILTKTPRKIHCPFRLYPRHTF